MMMTYYSLFEKECKEITGNFYYGPALCGCLTRRRWRNGWKLQPICRECDKNG